MLRDRQMMQMMAMMMRGQQPPERKRRGCGCSPFWLVFLLMLPCDIVVLLSALGVLQKIIVPGMRYLNIK
jgi:hypothetical protein